LAPPTQGRAGASSQLVATEKLHHAIFVALVPNAEFTIKMWVTMSPADTTPPKSLTTSSRRRSTPPLDFVHRCGYLDRRVDAVGVWSLMLFDLDSHLSNREPVSVLLAVLYLLQMFRNSCEY
jgi:hypothetical protein